MFGTEFHYFAGEKVINLSSEIFGFNGCSSAIQSGKASLGLSVRQEILQKDMGVARSRQVCIYWLWKHYLFCRDCVWREKRSIYS